MKIHRNKNNIIASDRIIIFSVLLIISLPLSLFSQEKITLSGKITDANTGEELIGASVRLKGTYFGASAGSDGVYKIQNIEPNTYTIEVSLVGYKSVIKTGVSITGVKNLILDFQLRESSILSEEVVVLGERPLIDVESASSSSLINKEVLSSTAARDIKEIAATQVGITQTPFGLYIRGGRSYETGVLIDGVSVSDPLSGTGFGVELNAKSLEEIEITTGGAGVEYGEAPSGIIALKVKEGKNNFTSYFEHRRDNIGFSNYSNPKPPNNASNGGGWNSTFYDFSFSGPLWRDKLFFFLSASAQFSDEFTRNPANKLKSSLVSDFFSPFNDNRWSSLVKLTWNVANNDKLTFVYSRSILVNQNTQMLQITGNDVQLQPGYQYRFLLLPDNANLYTSDQEVQTLQWNHIFSKNALLKFQASRLFSRLRGEVSGRPWRPDFITEDLNPTSVIKNPTYFNPYDSIVIVNAADGFINSGIAPLWHDHFAEDYTINLQLNYNTDSGIQNYLFGVESKFSNYQWIDIVEPWVGAPVFQGDISRRLGTSADIWAVQPAQGAVFISDKIKYKGFNATLGLRLQYWFPGKFADDAVENPKTLIPDGFRTAYYNNTGELFGRRYQLRLLPKINISFPVSVKQVLFFNYTHSSRLPHPRWVYRGLDPRYIENSFSNPIGNPSLKPETTVSYEIGLRNEVTQNDALTITAFYKDQFDFIVSRVVSVTDPRTNNLLSRQAYVNQAYARSRGLEVSYQRRIGKWFQGTVSGAYQIVTGKSNSAEESVASINRTGSISDFQEIPLAWDRPIDLKTTLLFKQDGESGLFGISFLNDLKLLINMNYSSGLRYTPATFIRNNPETGRPEYQVEPNTIPYSGIGNSWFWTDLSLEKNIKLNSGLIRLSLQVKNLFNNKNSSVLNPTTGRAYEFGDPVSLGTRDPKYPDPLNDSGTSPLNPARYLSPLQLVFGFAVDL